VLQLAVSSHLAWISELSSCDAGTSAFSTTTKTGLAGVAALAACAATICCAALGVSAVEAAAGAASTCMVAAGAATGAVTAVSTSMLKFGAEQQVASSPAEVYVWLPCRVLNKLFFLFLFFFFVVGRRRTFSFAVLARKIVVFVLRAKIFESFAPKF